MKERSCPYGGEFCFDYGSCENCEWSKILQKNKRYRAKIRELKEDLRNEKHNHGVTKEFYNNSVANSEKIFAEQKAEIERLTLAVEGFKGENKVIHKENDELLGKIERLTKENGYLNQCADNFLADYQKAQKQVDELKEERDVFKNLFEHCNNSSITIDQIIESMNSFYREQAEHFAELKIEQAVKDTAKEIYGEIDDSDIIVVNTQEYGEIDVVPIERLKEIIKCKGVEVE